MRPISQAAETIRRCGFAKAPLHAYLPAMKYFNVRAIRTKLPPRERSENGPRRQ